MQKNENRNSSIEELRKGFRTAFIDGEYNSNLAYRPEFLSNNAAEGKKVLSAIESELLRCDEFAISVAFITNSGIEPFMQTFKELEHRNIPGKILTTNYLNFSDPKALRRLSSCRIWKLECMSRTMNRKVFIPRVIFSGKMKCTG